MALCNHDSTGKCHALVSAREMRAGLGVLADAAELGIILGLWGVLHVDCERILTLDGQGGGDLALFHVIFLRREDREFGLGCEHCHGPTHLGFTLNSVTISKPNISTATTFDNGDASAHAALVIVRPLKSGFSLSWRRTASDIRGNIATDIEKSRRDRQRRPEEDVKSQQGRGERDRHDKKNRNSDGRRIVLRKGDKVRKGKSLNLIVR